MDPLTHIVVGRAVVAAADRHEPARRRVGWPIVSPVVTLPLVAMADPWLIGICIAGLLALWPALSDVGGGGVEGPRRPRLRTVSRGVLTGAIVLLGIKGVLLARAL